MRGDIGQPAPHPTPLPRERGYYFRHHCHLQAACRGIWHSGLGAALLVALPLYVFGTFNHDLWRPTEAREAGIAREMIETGNWTATYLNGHLFLEKPPLYTWAIALALKLFGCRDWVVRIPVFLFTVGTLVATFALARRQLSRLGAQAAVVSLATMWLFIEVNHGAMIDNGLVFIITLAMLALYRLHERERPEPAWIFVFYFSVGLAFLCKGGVGAALIVAAAGGFILAGRRWAFAWRMHPFFGLALVAIMAGGWVLALWLKGGEQYFRVFFIENNLQRFTGQTGPTEEWFYHLGYIFVAPFPWTILIPCGIWALWKTRRADVKARIFTDFLTCWMAAMFLLLSIAGSKDNQYLLPLLPPLAVICGAWVAETFSGRPLPGWGCVATWIFAIIAIAGIAALPLAPLIMHQRIYWGALLWTLGLATIGGMSLPALRRRAWRAVWMRLALLAVGAGFALGLFAEKALNEMKGAKPLCSFLRANLPAGAEFWGYDLNENTEGLLVFYGWRPERLPALDSAATLAQKGNAVFLLLISHAARYAEAERLLKTDRWKLVQQIYLGNRFYWLLATCPPEPNG